MTEQTIFKTCRYPYCPKDVNQYNRLIPSRESPKWVANPWYRQGRLVNKANESYNKYDVTNSSQCKQIYGDTTYKYINRDDYPKDYNMILDKEKTEGSKYLPYYIPDPRQYPVYEWQKSYSAYRTPKPFEQYHKSSIKTLSEIQTNKEKSFNRVY